MSPVRIEPASPGCCLLSLLLLPFHFILFPFRLIITPGRRGEYRGPGQVRPDSDRWI